MKNKVPCELIRDLFPSYIDELTSDVTNEWVEEHLSDCQECQSTLDAMREPDTEADDEKEEKEIDFLKRTRKKIRNCAIASVLLSILLFLGYTFMRTFVVGDYVESGSVICKVKVEGSKLTVKATLADSARVPSHVEFEQADGIVTVSYKAVMSSPINNRDAWTAEYDAGDEKIRQVRVGDRIIWADGEDISTLTSEVYKTRHPYIGDPVANGETAIALNMANYLGNYTCELKTTEEPYAWTFRLEEDISKNKREDREEAMRSYAYVLLSMIENLSEVHYEYTVDQTFCECTITLADADAFAGYKIKECYESPGLLEALIQKTKLQEYAYVSVDFVRQIDQEVVIHVVNTAEDDIYTIGMKAYENGEVHSSIGSQVASGEPYERGDSISFQFYPSDFGISDWGSGEDLKLEVLIGDKEMKESSVSRFGIAPEGGMEYTYILSGNAKSGYTISQ